MEVPRRKLETGKRAFSYAAPTIWNNLPQTIRQIDLASVSLSSFIKSAYLLTYLHLTLAHSKGQSQGRVHFDCEYLANGDR